MYYNHDYKYNCSVQYFNIFLNYHITSAWNTVKHVLQLFLLQSTPFNPFRERLSEKNWSEEGLISTHGLCRF